jgi:hypothetical protein
VRPRLDRDNDWIFVLPLPIGEAFCDDGTAAAQINQPDLRPIADNDPAPFQGRTGDGRETSAAGIPRSP